MHLARFSAVPTPSKNVVSRLKIARHNHRVLPQQRYTAPPDPNRPPNAAFGIGFFFGQHRPILFELRALRILFPKFQNVAMSCCKSIDIMPNKMAYLMWGKSRNRRTKHLVCKCDKIKFLFSAPLTIARLT